MTSRCAAVRWFGFSTLVGAAICLLGFLYQRGDDRPSIYRWENGRCYRIRFALHGALASARSETYASRCPKPDDLHKTAGSEWRAVADCHFVDCAESSLTGRIAKQRGFTSTTGFGQNKEAACENAMYQLKDMLRRDQCTPTTCTCYKAWVVGS